MRTVHSVRDTNTHTHTTRHEMTLCGSITACISFCGFVQTVITVASFAKSDQYTVLWSAAGMRLSPHAKGHHSDALRLQQPIILGCAWKGFCTPREGNVGCAWTVVALRDEDVGCAVCAREGVIAPVRRRECGLCVLARYFYGYLKWSKGCLGKYSVNPLSDAPKLLSRHDTRTHMEGRRWFVS